MSEHVLVVLLHLQCTIHDCSPSTVLHAVACTLGVACAAAPPGVHGHAQPFPAGLDGQAPRSPAAQQEWKQAPYGLDMGHKAMQQPMPQQTWDGGPQDGSPGLAAGSQSRLGPGTGPDGYAPGTAGPRGYGAGVGGGPGLPPGLLQQQQRPQQRAALGTGAPPPQRPGPTAVEQQEQALAEARQQQQQRSAAAAAALQNFSKRSTAPAAAAPQQPQVPAHRQPPLEQRSPQMSPAQQAAWMREHNTVQVCIAWCIVSCCRDPGLHNRVLCCATL